MCRQMVSTGRGRTYPIHSQEASLPPTHTPSPAHTHTHTHTHNTWRFPSSGCTTLILLHRRYSVLSAVSWKMIEGISLKRLWRRSSTCKATRLRRSSVRDNTAMYMLLLAQYKMLCVHIPTTMQRLLWPQATIGWLHTHTNTEPWHTSFSINTQQDTTRPNLTRGIAMKARPHQRVSCYYCTSH